MAALRENTSSNFADVKNLEFADNTGTSKTVSFASTVSEIDWQFIIGLPDATPVPVTSSTPMQNREKIDIDATKNSDTSKELLQTH